MARRSGLTLRNHTCLPNERFSFLSPPKRRFLLLWRFSFALSLPFLLPIIRPLHRQPIQKHMLLSRNLHAITLQSACFYPPICMLFPRNFSRYLKAFVGECAKISVILRHDEVEHPLVVDAHCCGAAGESAGER